MRILSQRSYASLEYVYGQFLSMPYSDVSGPRGYYLNESGKYLPYPKDEQLTSKPNEVYRPNHGLAHNIRVTSKVQGVIALYCDESSNTHPQLRALFSAFNAPDQIEKLEIVASFYIACRGSEAGFSEEADSPYQRYRKASSEAFARYAKGLRSSGGDPLFSDAELTLYQEVLHDPYFNISADRSALLSENQSVANRCAVMAIISSCHALDLARCFDHNKMNHKMSEVLAPIVDEGSENAKQFVNSLFIQAEVQHILTGNKCKSVFDRIDEKFNDAVISEKLYLFRLANTNVDVAARLIALSAHISTTDQAKKLAVALNRFAMRGLDELNQFLVRIENCFTPSPSETIDSILMQEKSDTGRIFKSIRADGRDFWDQFASEMVNPSVSKPELRSGPRKKYTIKLKDGRYQILPTNKAEKRKLEGEGFNKADKQIYSRHQSTSYSNYEAGYTSSCFGDAALRSTLLAGVSFPSEECQLKRIMIFDGGTFSRPYDFDTEEAARQYLDQNVRNGIWHTSLDSLQQCGLRLQSSMHNEVMAKFCWTSNSSITVFSNNLESRLLGQLRAQDLRNRFQEKYPYQKIVIPITIYPEFAAYSDEAQRKDIEEAKKDPGLEEFTGSLEFLSAPAAERNKFSIKSLSVLSRIKKTNQKVYREYKAASTQGDKIDIHHAIRSRDIAQLKLALAQDVESVCETKDGATPIQLAVKLGYWDCVIAIARAVKTDGEDNANYGFALLFAAQQNKQKAFLQLLKSGADCDTFSVLHTCDSQFDLHPDSRDYQAYSLFATHYLIKNDDTVALEALLTKHSGTAANIKRVENNGAHEISPISTALMLNRGKAVGLLLMNGGVPTDVDDDWAEYAAKRGNWLAIYEYLNHMDSARCQSVAGRLLHEAVRQNNKDAVRNLVARNPHVTYLKEDKTSIQLAVELGHWSCVSEIAGAVDTDENDTARYELALLYAARQNKKEIFLKLVKAGASCTRWSISHKCDANFDLSPDSRGYQSYYLFAIHYVIKNNDLDALAVMLEKYSGTVANIKRTTENGVNEISPLSMALTLDRSEAVALLLSHGAVPTKKDSDRAEYAAKKGRWLSVCHYIERNKGKYWYQKLIDQLLPEAVRQNDVTAIRALAAINPSSQKAKQVISTFFRENSVEIKRDFFKSESIARDSLFSAERIEYDGMLSTCRNDLALTKEKEATYGQLEILQNDLKEQISVLSKEIKTLREELAKLPVSSRLLAFFEDVSRKKRSEAVEVKEEKKVVLEKILGMVNAQMFYGSRSTATEKAELTQLLLKNKRWDSGFISDRTILLVNRASNLMRRDCVKGGIL